MRCFSIVTLSLFALCSSATAQDIILLNQDGEKVGVAKDVAEKVVPKAEGDSAKGEAVEAKKAGENGSASIKDGVITVIGPEGKAKTFKMSDARSVTITRSSKTVVGDDGKPKVMRQGKAILIGPDGVRREIELGEGGLGGTVVETKAPKTWMIGISCQPASKVLRAQLQLEEDMGLVITRVLQGGAAENAGIQANDILMFAEQKPIGNRKQLSEVVNEAGAAGNDVTFTVLRGGEEISLTATPTEREGMQQVMSDLGGGVRVFEGFPGMAPGADFEFRQFGPGIILDRGAGGRFDMEHFGDVRERHREMIEKMNERVKQMQKEMDAIRGGIENGK